MDEAERCHRLAYIAYGNLLTHGTVAEVIRHVGLHHLVRRRPGLDATRAANSAASRACSRRSSSASALARQRRGCRPRWKRAIAPFRREPYAWQQIPSGLEDVFIHLMENSPDNFAAPES